MSKDEVLVLINSRDYISLLRTYCMENGKDPDTTEKFISLIGFMDSGYLINYTIDYYCRKFDIILVSDKNGKFIKAF